MRELVKLAANTVFDFKNGNYSTNNFIVRPALQIVELCAEIVSFGDYRIFMQCLCNREIKEQSLEVLLDRYGERFDELLENKEVVHKLEEAEGEFDLYLYELYDNCDVKPYKEFHDCLKKFLHLRSVKGKTYVVKYDNEENAWKVYDGETIIGLVFEESCAEPEFAPIAVLAEGLNYDAGEIEQALCFLEERE